MDGVKVLVGEGVNDGVEVIGALVMDGVNVIDGVKDGVSVNVFVGGGRKTVAVNVEVGVSVEVDVGVGVFVMVCVTINGVSLMVGVTRVLDGVMVGVHVSVGVSVS